MDKAKIIEEAQVAVEAVAAPEESKMDDGGPAFPLPETKDGKVIPDFYCKGMTIRDYACIHLKVPDSGRDWLDKIIMKSLKNEFAGHAFTALSISRNRGAEEFVANMASEMADIMLKKVL